MTHADGAVGANALRTHHEAISHARTIGGLAWETLSGFPLDRVRSDDVVIAVGDEPHEPPLAVASRRHSPTGVTIASRDGRSLRVEGTLLGTIQRPLN